MDGLVKTGLYRRLAYDNPWWDGPDIEDVALTFQPERPLFSDFADKVKALGVGGALILVGPKGAGKSDFLKRYAVNCLNDGFSARSILRLSFATPALAGHRLSSLFSLFVERFNHQKATPLLVLVDEPVYGGDWQADLKQLTATWPNVRFLLALSSGAPGLLTGEKDEASGADIFVVPPLNFQEFLRFRDTEQQIFGPAAAVDGGKAVLQDQMLGCLNDEFAAYVNFGADAAILASEATDLVPLAVRDGLIDRQLHRDTAGLFGISDIQELNRLFTLLALNTGRETSMEDLAKTTGIAKNTVRKYLDYLEGAFLIRRLVRVDKDAKPFQRQVLFKVVLCNPNLYAALFGPVAPDEEAFARLAFGAIITQFLGRGDMKNLAYASWRGGAVDFLMLDEAGQPQQVFESDWQGAFGRKSKGPKKMTAFIKNTNKAASATVLTRWVSLPATHKGLTVNLVPLAYYAYWLSRGESVD